MSLKINYRRKVEDITFSYGQFPQDSLKDEVRFIIGDTSSSSSLVRDEEIYFLLSVFPNPLRASAMAMDALASKFARQAIDKKVGDLALDLRQKSKLFQEEAHRLWILSKEFRGRPQVFAGGYLKSQKQAQDQNTDRIRPDFYSHMNDLPGTIIGTSS
jgi:hypothetical protein